MQRSETPPPAPGQARVEALAAGRAYLRAAGGETADADARLLLMGVCRIEPVALVTRGDAPLSQAEAEQFRAFLDRRVAGEPTSRILGRRAFWTLDLEVRPGVLDPRGDSEALVRLALRVASANTTPTRRILDLGCGSGALLCALLSEREEAFGVGVDLSAEACAATRINLARNGLSERAAVLRGRWCEALRGPFDLVVSNPPYIPSCDIAGLELEVRAHDPRLALDGGADGLEAYRALFASARRILAPGGALAVEFGFGQAGPVETIARAAALQKIGGERDIAGRDRAAAFVAA